MNDQSDMKSRPRQVGEVWVRRESDEAAIDDPLSGALHRLNPSALAIWELCDGDTTVEEMAAAIAEVTSLDMTSAAADVVTALDRLVDLRLVEL